MDHGSSHRVVERELSYPRRHGVLFVHGVGQQLESETLLDIGGALVGWLTRWYAQRRAGDGVPLIERVELGFASFDTGGAPRLSHGKVHLPTGDTWMLAEAWWASSYRRPDLGIMIRWSGRYLWDIVWQMCRALWQRAIRLVRPKPQSSDPPLWARLIDLVNSVGLLVLYTGGALAGYVLLFVLFLATQLPIPALKDLVLVRLLQPFLQVNVGEFRTYIDDDLQAANLRRRVADAVVWLRKRCDDVTIVAHSEGAVVSFGMLSDPAFHVEANCVRKLITVGEGLNKSWEIKPALTQRPLAAHVHWLDVWTAYDPIPAGYLRPPRSGGKWATIFAPDARVVREQRLVPRADPDPETAPPCTSAEGQQALGSDAADLQYWPVSEQVTNEMDVLADHGGYWDNDEQVLIRLAAEIDAPFYRESPFWRGDATLATCEERTKELTEAVQKRREYVSMVALARDVAVLAAVAGMAASWVNLHAHDIGPWTTYDDVARQASPPWGVALVSAVVQRVDAWIPPLGAVLTPVLALPMWLIDGAVFSLIAIAIFEVWYTLWWNRAYESEKGQRVRSLQKVANA